MASPTDLTRSSESYALVPRMETDDPAIIRRQIDLTRAQMEKTIQTIGERLSPENIIEQAKTSAKEATVGRIKDMTYQANQTVDKVSNSLGQTIRDNPLPVALIGLGLGWLYMSGRNKEYSYPADRYGYRSGPYGAYRDEPSRLEDAREWVDDVAYTAERKVADVKARAGDAVQEMGENVSETAQRAGEAVSETAQRAGETVSETVYKAGEAVGEAVETAQERIGETAERARMEAERLRREAQWRGRLAVDRSKRSFWENMEENPLVVGAVVAVAGLAVGASIPTTDYENQLLGETRDRLFDEAKDRAQDAVERVQAVVEDTQRAAVTEAKQAAQRHHLTVEDIISDDNGNNGTELTYTAS
jgi:ElaB/YqjD/DUF883 family membrane-anchored ribosome-binding protein